MSTDETGTPSGRFLGPDDDDDTASQKSISLSSPRDSVTSIPLDVDDDILKRGSLSSATTGTGTEASTDHEHEVDPDTPDTSAAPSVFSDKDISYAPPPLSASSSHSNNSKSLSPTLATPNPANNVNASSSPSPTHSTYPPTAPHLTKRDTNTSAFSDSHSIAESFQSTNSRKARPESKLFTELKDGDGLVLGIALVDFDHGVGPRIEWSRATSEAAPKIFEDDEVTKILAFLALPDGAHLREEDYSYFHLVPTARNPRTVFGISCNRQIPAADLLVKPDDVTRSTVQKAVVVLTSKPVSGAIRDKLCVVTSALFLQRDFSSLAILDDFSSSLEPVLKGQLTESGLYIGTNVRELVKMFRQRTLILVKALILQKRVMFLGHPVERLCTYQYSLVSLIPGLLQTLQDCGSPPLASRAPTLSRPSELRTSDPKSMQRYLGLPLDVFGKDSFFQPYLPLQQLDMIAGTGSWLCGSTNSIVTQRKEIELLVNTETGALDFREPKLWNMVGLTASDRKWMDEIVRDVTESYTDEEQGAMSQYRGSEDYLRQKFEEYISGFLASVRYKDFLAKGEGNGPAMGTGVQPNSTDDFNPLFLAEFKKTNAYEVWDRVTDPSLFDIVEPRHPTPAPPTMASDIGLRLQEGIVDLKLDQQFAPAREAIGRTFTAGSTGFFKAVEGVKGRWTAASEARARSNSVSPAPSAGASGSSSPTHARGEKELSLAEALKEDTPGEDGSTTAKPAPEPSSPSAGSSSQEQTPQPMQRPTLAAWGSGLGSWVSKSAPRFSFARQGTGNPPTSPTGQSQSEGGSGSAEQTKSPRSSGYKPLALGRALGAGGFMVTGENKMTSSPTAMSTNLGSPGPGSMTSPASDVSPMATPAPTAEIALTPIADRKDGEVDGGGVR